ncbi:hypothetical protein JKP88DRAFT_264676 [Tribonema minus]|uniref:Uncharacterized protein n=1 Tax=Tribonema minus TaxID=303371 RepID=A0A835YXM5_9STRA|nr:hypothetical protein JKP88DRAFT_264676 [Tribonema minus]
MQHACITYALKSSLYVSVTNLSNTITLPASRGPGFKMPAVFKPLPDDFEPSATEVLESLTKELSRQPTSLSCPRFFTNTQSNSPTFSLPAGAYQEIVFAGLGEPTLRWGVVRHAAEALRRSHPHLPLRLTTNGIGALADAASPVLDVDTLALEACALFEGAAIALNTADAAQYDAIMKPRLRGGSGGGGSGTAHARVCRFVEACAEGGMKTECTVVEAPGVDVAAAMALARVLGAGQQSCCVRHHVYALRGGAWAYATFMEEFPEDIEYDEPSGDRRKQATQQLSRGDTRSHDEKSSTDGDAAQSAPWWRHPPWISANAASLPQTADTKRSTDDSDGFPPASSRLPPLPSRVSALVNGKLSLAVARAQQGWWRDAPPPDASNPDPSSASRQHALLRQLPWTPVAAWALGLLLGSLRAMLLSGGAPAVAAEEPDPARAAAEAIIVAELQERLAASTEDCAELRTATRELSAARRADANATAEHVRRLQRRATQAAALLAAAEAGVEGRAREAAAAAYTVGKREGAEEARARCAQELDRLRKRVLLAEETLIAARVAVGEEVAQAEARAAQRFELESAARETAVANLERKAAWLKERSCSLLVAARRATRGSQFIYRAIPFDHVVQIKSQCRLCPLISPACCAEKPTFDAICFNDAVAVDDDKHQLSPTKQHQPHHSLLAPSLNVTPPPPPFPPNPPSSNVPPQGEVVGKQHEATRTRAEAADAAAARTRSLVALRTDMEARLAQEAQRLRDAADDSLEELQRRLAPPPPLMPPRRAARG